MASDASPHGVTSGTCDGLERPPSPCHPPAEARGKWHVVGLDNRDGLGMVGVCAAPDRLGTGPVPVATCYPLLQRHEPLPHHIHGLEPVDANGRACCVCGRACADVSGQAYRCVEAVCAWHICRTCWGHDEYKTHWAPDVRGTSRGRVLFYVPLHRARATTPVPRAAIGGRLAAEWKSGCHFELSAGAVRGLCRALGPGPGSVVSKEFEVTEDCGGGARTETEWLEGVVDRAAPVRPGVRAVTWEDGDSDPLDLIFDSWRLLRPLRALPEPRKPPSVAVPKEKRRRGDGGPAPTRSPDRHPRPPATPAPPPQDCAVPRPKGPTAGHTEGPEAHDPRRSPADTDARALDQPQCPPCRCRSRLITFAGRTACPRHSNGPSRTDCPAGPAHTPCGAEGASVVRFLDALGATHAAHAVAKWPNLASCSVTDHLRPTIEYLQALGVRDIGPVVRKHGYVLTNPLDRTRAVVHALQEVAGLDVGRVVQRHPPTLLLGLETNLRPTLQYLETLGLVGSRLGKMLNRYPNFLCFSIGSRLAPRVADLQELGVRDVAAVLAVFPQVVSLSFCDNIRPTVQFLRSIGVEDVGDMIARHPQMLGYSLVAMRTKWEWLCRWGYSSADVVRFPHFFGYSLEQRIAPRLAFLQRHRPGHRPGLTGVLVPPDDKFAHMAFASPQLWTAFQAAYRHVPSGGTDGDAGSVDPEGGGHAGDDRNCVNAAHSAGAMAVGSDGDGDSDNGGGPAGENGSGTDSGGGSDSNSGIIRAPGSGACCL